MCSCCREEDLQVSDSLSQLPKITSPQTPPAWHVTDALPPLEQLAEQVAPGAAPAQLAGQLPLRTIALGRPEQVVGAAAAQAATQDINKAPSEVS
jgi:hypothetical protein